MECRAHRQRRGHLSSSLQEERGARRAGARPLRGIASTHGRLHCPALQPGNSCPSRDCLCIPAQRSSVLFCKYLEPCWFAAGCHCCRPCGTAWRVRFGQLIVALFISVPPSPAFLPDFAGAHCWPESHSFQLAATDSCIPRNLFFACAHAFSQYCHETMHRSDIIIQSPTSLVRSNTCKAREYPSTSAIASTSSISLPARQETEFNGVSQFSQASNLAQSLAHAHSQQTPGYYLPKVNSQLPDSSHSEGHPHTHVRWQDAHPRPQQGQSDCASQNHTNSGDGNSSVFKAAAMDKRTPLKHERVVVTVESPPDGLCSAANSPTSLGPGGYAVQEGTPRLKLKLTAVHPALTQLIQRCGFNAQLQLTFKPGGKSIGRYFTSSSTQRAFAIFAALDLVVRGCGGVLT